MKDNVSRLSYTSKDYENIYHDLLSAIPNVSKLWDTDSESDPGIVLVKLMSMLGDMLSYNFDMQVLELFPNSVTQRKNARQIFGLIGYKTHWYRSARCNVSLKNNSAKDGIVPIYTRFSDNKETITYTNLRQYNLPASDDIHVTLELIQGIPITPTKLQSDAIAKYDVNWHSIYDYNVIASNIRNNKIYFPRKNVEETTIRLIDEYGTEWTQVESLETQTITGKMYEFKVDEEDNPYIELCGYWEGYNCNKFKLFYILSLGEAGQVADSIIDTINTAVVAQVYSSDNGTNTLSTVRINDNVSIVESSASTDGYYPEEPNEARYTSANYINTFNTLITLDDFRKSIKRLEGIANCMATDYTTDPTMDMSDDVTNTDKYTVKLYVVRSPEYEESDNDSFKSAIITSLYDKKMIPLNIIVDLESINRYYWTVKGEIYLTEPTSKEKSNQIILKINDALSNNYNINKSEFNEVVKYIDVVSTMKNSDPLIKYIDLDDIEFKNSSGEIVTKQEITGKYTEDINKPITERDGIYRITISNAPIKPGSVCIRSANMIITDNKNGKLLSNNSVVFSHGNVDYRTGEVEFHLYDTRGQLIDGSGNPVTDDYGNPVYDQGYISYDFKISYQKNVVNIIEYSTYTVGDLIISPDSLVDEDR